MSSIRLDVEHRCLRIDDRKYFYEEKGVLRFGL